MDLESRKLKSTVYTHSGICIWVRLKFGKVSLRDMLSNLTLLGRSVFEICYLNSLRFVIGR